jgi:hypothetical protein
MVSENDPRPVLRQELARVFKNQRVIRAFEKIFDLIPPEFISQQIQIDTIGLIAELANSQAVDAIAALERLTSAIDKLACAPPLNDIVLQDDLRPRDELGTLASQQSDRVNISGGNVTATLTDDTNILMASSTALANGAAAAAGTLLNAPAAGNPTKWVTINDNGVNRQIPTW